MLLHVVAFRLDIDSQQNTPWHLLVPQMRLLCVLLGVFAIAFTPNGHWLTWGIYGLGLFGIILLSQVTLLTLLKRVAVEFAFVAVVLIGTLFRDGGTVLWSWGMLKITTVGLTVLGSVTFKAFLSLSLLNVLILTTSIPAILNAFIALRMPPLLVAIMSSMYRYLGVLITEFNTMRQAAISRNLMANKSATRLIIGNIMGSLFIRTYERGERIHQAMLARGYQGLPPVEKVSPLKQRDFLALAIAIIWIVFGQAISFVTFPN